MEDREFEWLTAEICHEYKKRAELLSSTDGQDIGARRTLRMELQKRCHITEIEAVNILNGYNVDLYVHKYDVLSGKIPVPQGYEVQNGRLVKIDKKRSVKDVIGEYEERIAYLEEKAGKADDGFRFEENKD